MKKPSGAIITLILILAASCAATRNGERMQPTWEENFDRPVAEGNSRWTKIPRGRSDWNRHMSYFDSCYGWRDGKLVLRGIRNTTLPGDTSQYLTGGVYTKDKVSFGLGRLEIRAKLGGARGAWPAFWMLGQGMKYPEGGEIDIMEHLNYDTIVYQTVHSYYTITLNLKDTPKHSETASIHPGQFNIYAVEKYRDSIVFYVNNKRTFAYPRIRTDKQGQFPFTDSEHYLLLDMQLGGNWVGQVAEEALPVEMEIDWVRFYAFPPSR